MPVSTDADVETNTSAYDFVIRDAKKNEYPMSQHKGNVTVVLNIAMKCGFTQTGMTTATDIYNKYKEQGVTVLGFPSNEFNQQNPQNEEETVAEACSRFKADFPIMKKITVNGDTADPLWKWLKKKKPGLLGTEGIKWNFTFFVIDRDGQPVARFAPGVKTEDVEKKVVKLLNGETLENSFASTRQSSTSQGSLANGGDDTHDQQLLEKNGNDQNGTEPQPKQKEKLACCCC